MTDVQDTTPPVEGVSPAQEPTPPVETVAPVDILALVIEHDPDAAFIFQKAMLDNGYRVQHFNHGDEASKALKTLLPDIILLDLHLPVVGGVALLDQIRNTPELAQVPVILITADHSTASSLDADMVLLKPATYSQVKGLVKRILAKKLGE